MNRLKVQVEKAIPHLLSGSTYTVKEMCDSVDRAFWTALRKSKQGPDAGACMVYLLSVEDWPLILLDARTDSNDRQYLRA